MNRDNASGIPLISSARADVPSIRPPCPARAYPRPRAPRLFMALKHLILFLLKAPSRSDTCPPDSRKTLFDSFPDNNRKQYQHRSFQKLPSTFRCDSKNQSAYSADKQTFKIPSIPVVIKIIKAPPRLNPIKRKKKAPLLLGSAFFCFLLKKQTPAPLNV